MRLTRAGEYGVRCILYLSSQGVGVLCRRKQIAAGMDIPDQFLGKIAQQPLFLIILLAVAALFAIKFFLVKQAYFKA